MPVRTTIRRGVVILELFAAASVLLVLLVIAAQGIEAMSRARRQFERRAAALHECANLLEQVAAMPWHEVTAARVEGLVLSDAAQSRLGSAQLTARLVENADDAGRAKKVLVEISYGPRGASGAASAQLVRWFYPQEGEP